MTVRAVLTAATQMHEKLAQLAPGAALPDAPWAPVRPTAADRPGRPIHTAKPESFQPNCLRHDIDGNPMTAQDERPATVVVYELNRRVW